MQLQNERRGIQAEKEREKSCNLTRNGFTVKEIAARLSCRVLAKLIERHSPRHNLLLFQENSSRRPCCSPQTHKHHRGGNSHAPCDSNQQAPAAGSARGTAGCTQSPPGYQLPALALPYKRKTTCNLPITWIFIIMSVCLHRVSCYAKPETLPFEESLL